MILKTTVLLSAADVDWLIIFNRVGWSDVAFVLALTLGIFFGLKNGLTAVLRYAVAVVLAQSAIGGYLHVVSSTISGVAPLPMRVFEIAAYIFMAGSIFFIVRFLFYVTDFIIKYQFKSAINNILGALVGGATFVLALGLISSFLMLFPFHGVQNIFTGRSISGQYLLSLNRKVFLTTGQVLPKKWRPPLPPDLQPLPTGSLEMQTAGTSRPTAGTA